MIFSLHYTLYALILRSTQYGDRTPTAVTPPVMDISRNVLPWKSKVREEEIEEFLQNERFITKVWQNTDYDVL